MSRIKQWINRLSVKRKLIFYGYLIITPVLILLCCILLIHNYGQTMDKKLEADLKGVMTLADSIQVLQDDIKDLSTYISINNDVGRLLKTKNVHELNGNSRLWLDNAPMEIIQNMIALKGHIKTLAIYPENGVRPYLSCIDGSALMFQTLLWSKKQTFIRKH